jgi:recombination protein RecA
MGERILKDVPGAVLVFDSLSAMTAPGTMEKGINEAGDRSSGYKLAAQFCSLMKSVVPANRSIFIGIAHQYANTSGMGPAKRGKMPNSFKYQATTHLEFKWAKRWRTGGAEEDSKGPQIGIIPHIFVKHSSLTASGGEFPMYARFGVGIDKVYELIQLGVELGLVRQLGSWFSLPWAEGEPKAQGTEKLYQLLDANPALATNLADKIREATS